MISLSYIGNIMNKLPNFINMAKISTTSLCRNNYIIRHVQHNYYYCIYKSVPWRYVRHKSIKITINYSIFINYTYWMNMRFNTSKTLYNHIIFLNIFHNYHAIILNIPFQKYVIYFTN